MDGSWLADSSAHNPARPVRRGSFSDSTLYTDFGHFERRSTRRWCHKVVLVGPIRVILGRMSPALQEEAVEAVEGA